jgi:HEPN domain-containing protein
MTKEELINYWVKSSDMDFETMEFLFSSKRYNWALFLGHLVIEKLFKSLFVKGNGKEAEVPKIHNLVILAEKTNIKLSIEQVKMLTTFNSFQLNTRYQDYKFKFYKKCTKKYTTGMIEQIREVRKWLKTLI